MGLRSLVIALDLPLPVAGGGDLRTLGVIEALRRLGPVGVFGVLPRPPEPSPIAGLAAWQSSTDAALADWRAQARAALGWVGRPGGQPSDRWWSEHAADELARLADRLEPDLVVVEQLWLYAYGQAIRAPGRRLVLDAHNAEAALHRDLAARPDRGRLPTALARKLADRVAALEATAVADADAVWAPSAGDAAKLVAGQPVARIDVVPNGIALDGYAGPPGPRGPVMVYPANFAYPPNTDAARRLVHGVRPAVAAANPGATLVLVGGGLPAELTAGAGVEAPGRVPDVRPYLHRASVMPVALSDGSGTRLKVLEAFAAGVAVVSTRKGVEGLAVGDGEHVLLAESDAQLAAAVLRVWADEPLRAGLVARARALVDERYGPDAVAAAVAGALGAGGRGYRPAA
jgi:glycosyltransferase involved in cell wall biosynthesis